MSPARQHPGGRIARIGRLAAVRRATIAPMLAAAVAATPGVSTASSAAVAVPPRPGAAGSLPSRPTRATAWVATVIAPSLARTRPDGGRRIARVPTATPWDDAPVKLLVLGTRLDRGGHRWIDVDLDRRPNGSRGWIRADRTILRRDPWRIEISLARRSVTVRRRGHVRFAARAVVGAPATPTPTGLFAVTERIRQPDPSQFDGAWVLQLTAHSDKLASFAGGPGTIGIHGRGGVSLLTPLGTAGSHGCIRVDNNVVRRIADDVPAGTPVRIHR